MGGRIYRTDAPGAVLELPEIGRLKIGQKVQKNGKEFPVSTDYFIPAGKYAGLFTKAFGDRPNTVQIIFPDDSPELVCNERYEYRDNAGALVASGDGRVFKVWNGKRYEEFSAEKHPDLMERVTAKWPTRRGAENWDIVLTLRFLVPAVRGVIGVWQLSTKGRASSVKNIRESFDGVQMLRGTVTQTVFDLSVQFAKSNKPGDNSRYPVLSLVANDNRIEDVRELVAPSGNLALLKDGRG